jgi:hypothetical protein
VREATQPTSQAEKPSQLPVPNADGTLPAAQVSLVVSTNCRSAGEALRLIDQKDIIKADFVLVSVSDLL